MKPYRWILPVLVTTVAAVPVVGVATEDLNRTASTEVLLASLPQNRDTVWARVRQDTTIEELSLQLGVDETRLARLNDTDEDHRFQAGDWLALPTRSASDLRHVASIDASGLRNTLPLQSPPPVSAADVVRFGDTLPTISQRTGLSLAELLRLNPALESGRMTVGTAINVDRAMAGRSRMSVALKPSTSGGLSWPELPDYGRERPGNFDAGSTSWVWPAQGVFTSGYGWRWGRMHKGIDVANNVGTPIVAAASGRVTFAGWHDGGYGYLVEITHEDGSLTRYGHNSRILVREGDAVEQGQTISEMGSTGRSTGPHLHFEIHPAGSGAVNPLQYLPPRA